MTGPLVSVILPVYNGEKYLRDAIESILVQSYSHFELILVDDGSSDSSPSVLTECVARDSRVHVHTHQRNRGRIAALNTGLSIARGKYIARMDQDDVSLPERLAKQVSHLESHPEVGILGAAATVVDESGQPRSLMKFPLHHDLICWALCFYCPIIHPAVMARLDVMLSFGGYRAEYPLAEDYDLWTRLSLRTRIENLPESLVLLRKHGENDTITQRPRHLSDSANISREFIRTLTGFNLLYTPLELAWEPRRISASDLNQVAVVITALMERFISDLTAQERRYLRRETSLQLIRIIRNADSSCAAFNVLIRALNIDPLSFPRALQIAMHKLFSRNLWN